MPCMVRCQDICRNSDGQHNISQPPVHPCFARAMELIAHPKITPILSFSWEFSSKVAFLHTLKFHLHTLSCNFWLNLFLVSYILYMYKDWYEKSWIIYGKSGVIKTLTYCCLSHCWPKPMVLLGHNGLIQRYLGRCGCNSECVIFPYLLVNDILVISWKIDPR